MINYLINLLEYNKWATKQTAKSILNSNKELPEANRLISHIVAAQKLWMERISGETTGITPWEEYKTEDILGLSNDINIRWILLIKNKGNNFLETVVKYKTTNGATFENSIIDIITHLINHSTYHRAQIARTIRQEGETPSATDYILYIREKNK